MSVNSPPPNAPHARLHGSWLILVRVGWLVVAVFTLMLVTIDPIIETNTLQRIPSPWQVPTACLYFLALALLVLVFLLFPGGQFVPSFTRWTLVVFLVGQVPSTFFPEAPFTLHTHAAQVGLFLLIGEAALLAVVQLYRYRRVSSPLERQQTKWVVFGIALPISVFVGGTVLSLIFPALADPHSPSGSSYQLALAAVNTCTPLLFPISLGMAILRSRLWEYDIIIKRTLVYGTLTVILSVVYVGLVIALQALVRSILSQGNSYEVDLDQLREALLAVVQETMQPAHVSLWLLPTAPDRQNEPTRLSTPAHYRWGKELERMVQLL